MPYSGPRMATGPAPFRSHKITREGGRSKRLITTWAGTASLTMTSRPAVLAEKQKKARPTAMISVDIARSIDGYSVSRMQPGEWLSYSFDSDGAYTLHLVIGAKGSGTLSLSLNRGPEKAVLVNARGWSQIAATVQQVRKGRNVLIVKSTAGAPDFSGLTFGE